MGGRTLALVIAIAASALVTPAEAAKSRCTAAKYKAMGTKYLGKAKCYAKALQKDASVDLACLQKAETKFAVKWARAEVAARRNKAPRADRNECRIPAITRGMMMND